MNSKVFGPSTNIHKLLSGAALKVVKKRGLIEKEKQESILKAPNWSEWKGPSEVRVWEACALSFGIDPHSMTKERLPTLGSGPFFVNISFPDANLKSEFERRQNALLHNLSNHNHFSPCISNHGTQPGNRLVSLSEFAAWAVHEVNWGDMPLEFKALAQVGKLPPVASRAVDKMPLVLPTTVPVSQSETAAKVVRHKLRTNSLDVPIAKAVRQAGSLDTGAVYLELRELAICGEKPFTGELDGDPLCYTTDKNEPGKLTKNALRHRLGNHSL